MANDVKFKWNEAGLKELEEKGVVLLNEIAQDIKEKAKDLVSYKSGALRDSIEIYEGENKKEKEVGSKLGYALFVEMGTINQPPKSFLRNSLDQVIGEIR